MSTDIYGVLVFQSQAPFRRTPYHNTRDRSIVGCRCVEWGRYCLIRKITIHWGPQAMQGLHQPMDVFAHDLLFLDPRSLGIGTLLFQLSVFYFGLRMSREWQMAF